MSAQGDPGRGRAGIADESTLAGAAAAVAGQAETPWDAASGWTQTRATRGYPGSPIPDEAAGEAEAATVVRHHDGQGGTGQNARAGRDGQGRASAGPNGGAAAHQPPWGRPAEGQPSVWQQAANAWQRAGVIWQRPAEWAQGAMDRQRTEPIPVVRADEVPPGPTSAGAPDDAPQRRRAPSHRSSRARAGRRRTALLAGGACVLVAAILVGLAVRGRPPGYQRGGMLAGAPSARIAVADFAAGPGAASGPQAFPALSGLTGAGPIEVAFGSAAGLPARRPLFAVSADGGHTWRQAAVAGRAASGSLPVLAAGGQGRWLALGDGAAWTSSDGQRWTAGRGIAPLARGDRVLALARTAGGFLAVGENVTGHGRASTRTPVMWTSADGVSWQRRGAANLDLSAGGRQDRVGALRWVAAEGNVIMAGGDIARTTVTRRGQRKVSSVSYLAGVWQSQDGGGHWAAVAVPVSHGASSRLVGLAAAGQGMVAIRPGRAANGRQDAVAYVCAPGAKCQYAGTLQAPRTSMRARAVSGGADGAAVVGAVGRHQMVFVTADGRRWRRMPDLGRPADVVTGVMVGSGGTVVAAGAGGASTSLAAGPGRPFLTMGGVAGWLPVGQTMLARQSHPGVVVRSLASGPGMRVAVGVADGAPAIWAAAAGGRWTRQPGVSAPGGSARGLASVARGPAGWLAVGGGDPALSPSDPLGAPASVGPANGGTAPQVLTSSDGRAWRSAAGAARLTAPDVTLSAAAAGPAGYVVVGQQMRRGQPVAAAWWSANLATWAPLRWWTGASPPNLPSAMLAAAADGKGFIVVGGLGGHPEVWASVSSRRWRAVALPLPEGATSAVLSQVCAARGRLVAVGAASLASGPQSRLAAFAAVSTDNGTTWQESLLPAAGGGATAAALAGAPGGFVAGGAQGPAGSEQAAFWWSGDGLSWQLVRPAGAQAGGSGGRITAFSLDGSALTAAGYQISARGWLPMLWRIPLR